MIELPDALSKALKMKLTVDQWEDLYDFFESVYDEGRNDGLDEGKSLATAASADAFDAGYNDGVKETTDYWYEKNNSDCVKEYETGYEHGWEEGYAAGRLDESDAH